MVQMVFYPHINDPVLPKSDRFKAAVKAYRELFGGEPKAVHKIPEQQAVLMLEQAVETEEELPFQKEG